LTEPFGQHAFGIYAALSSIHVEQPHNIDSALPKNQTHCCKINLERSTDPRYSLSALWIFTALTSVFLSPDIGYQVLANAGVEGLLAHACVYSGSVVDFILGLWLLSGYKTKLCCVCQFITIFLYSVLLTAIEPGFWLHPFGPLTKNIPILVLILFIYINELEPSAKK
jgi:hypothetical protein